jgi:hypothetical protein
MIIKSIGKSSKGQIKSAMSKIMKSKAYVKLKFLFSFTAKGGKLK